MFLDKRLNLAEFLIGQCTLLLYDRAAVAANRELCGGTFGQLGIAGMDMHARNDTEGSVVQICCTDSVCKCINFTGLDPVRTEKMAASAWIEYVNNVN